MLKGKLVLITLFLMLGLMLIPQNAEAGDLWYGWQNTTGFYGASVVYNMSDSLAVQGIVSWNRIGGRGLFRFMKEENWNVYGYAGGSLHFIGFRPYMVAGGAYEFDWRIFGLDLGAVDEIPIDAARTNIELGVRMSPNFNPYMSFGVGTHFQF